MLTLLALLIALQTAFAQFVIFADKLSYTPSDTLVVSWSEISDSTLNLKSQDIGQILLCTCNSTNLFTCRNIKENLPVKDGKASFPVSDIAAFGPDGDYMLQFVTRNSGDKNQYALAYSQVWLSFTGMTGSGAAGKNCPVPSESNHGVPGTASSSIVSWTAYTLPSSLIGVPGYEIPYTWQKGATRTAPFQRTPGTKVTQTKTPSRRFPLSSMMSTFRSYYFNKYLPLQTATPDPVSQAYQLENAVRTLATIPRGRMPSRAIPFKSIQTGSSSSAQGRRRRWVD